ncbi:MAG TPA: hypothetical protein VFA55_08225, partial [Candidatus Kapabacteria bacterium]|nr:hypothetical protein [Candidatus Kapabacteria bacterium]
NSDIQGETSVGINPVNPNIIISGSNDYRGEHGSPTQYIYISTNAGNTWVNNAMPPCNSMYNAISDPSIAYDADGDAYFGFGAYNLGTGGGPISAVTVQRSLDGGIDWQDPVSVYTNASGAFEDKYFVTADANPSSPHKDNVYISWTNFTNYGMQNQNEQINISHSTDKGATWSVPVNLNADIGYGHLSMPTTGPDGEVYVVWSQVEQITTQIEFSYSLDGGSTFSSPASIAGVYTMPTVLPAKGNMRMLTYPAATVDNSSGSHHGRIYVTWAALNTSGGSQHIYLTYSDDKGGTWSTPKVVDNDPTTGTDKFHPWISCDPISGTVAVSYYDSQNDPTNSQTDLYTAYSSDGAQTFHVNRITSTSFNINPASNNPVQGGYWADYTGIAAYKGKIVPCWTDQRSGNSIYNTDVYVSIIKLGPRTVSDLVSSVNTNDPTGIVLTWQDPTTTLGGDPLTSFNVLIYRDSQYIGSVPSEQQTYTDDGLQTGSYHTYQLYVATATDTSDFVSVTGYAGGNLKPLPAVLTYTDEQSNGTLIQWKNPSAHIDNTPLYDFSKVYLYIDGSLVDSIPMTPQDTSKAIAHVIDHSFVPALTLKKFHSFNVVAVGTRGGFITPSVHSDTMIWYAGPANTTLSEGFESNPVFGTNGTWTTTNLGAHSGTQCLVDNTQLKSKARQNTYAMLPPTIVQPTATQFSFWQVALVSITDSAIAEFTTDNGNSWHTIGTYNINSGQFGSTVGASTWQNITYSMNSYIGDTVVFRFRLHTGAIPTQKAGWYIDDVMLQSAGSNAVLQSPVPVSDIVMTNYPNPFTGSTTITVSGLPLNAMNTPVSLVIADAAGNIVADLSAGLRMQASGVAIPFDAHALPAGTYYALLRAGSAEVRRQLVVMK